MTSRTIAAVLTALTLAETTEATVEQYASLVAEHEGEWRATVADIDDTCTNPDAVAIYAASCLTAGLQAESLSITLSAGHDPECKANPQCSLYLGEVPIEIAALVVSTEAAATDYIAAPGASRGPRDVACVRWRAAPL
jgi:hypothetical protein